MTDDAAIAAKARAYVQALHEYGHGLRREADRLALLDAQQELIRACRPPSPLPADEVILDGVTYRRTE